MYSVKNPYVWVAHVSMKMPARAYCSRIWSVMAMPMAMSEAEIEYSAHLQ